MLVAVFFIVLGIAFVLVANSKRHYAGLLEQNSEEAAKKSVNRTRKMGIALMILGGMYVGFLLAINGY